MQTGISVVHVTPVTPTSTAPTSLIPQAAPVSLFEDVIERITPPLEFRVWMEKLKTYAVAARGTEPADSPPVGEAERAAPAAQLVAEAAPVPGDGPAPDAAARTPQSG
ncbi:hypothetical protein [Paracoccus sp. S3-43]|uniref:hypothetical protein n=1 Tax=Paracoccus sp. S3-43 TaxID=3030011 RepID=UPI0023AFB7D1|nr:hypothetical protein [Paracoccus sp. S3-43]WEF23376.1 hypothetical protein PXD02_11190 [Paracoccus sp. S3-43]